MFGLTIAGFDPSAGAGLLADIKTFSALEVYGLGVITAITAQNPRKLSSIRALDTKIIEEEMDSILSFYDVEYAKTGMLYSKEIIKSVAKKSKEYDLKLIIDPVMVTSSGSSLADSDFVEYLKKYLLKQSILVTPNVDEAQKLSGVEINNQDNAIDASLKIGKYTNVLVTGGHLEGKSILYDGEISFFHNKLIESRNTHGTGCTLSAAIASFLIHGDDLKTAIGKSDNYVRNGIKNGLKGSLNHFYEYYSLE